MADDPADQRVFYLNDEQWAEFMALLDRPAEPDPKLVELFNRPSPFDTDT